MFSHVLFFMAFIFDGGCFYSVQWVSIIIALLCMCPVHDVYKNHFSSWGLFFGHTGKAPGWGSICGVLLLFLLLLWFNGLCFRSSFSSHLRYTLLVKLSHFNYPAPIFITLPSFLFMPNLLATVMVGRGGGEACPGSSVLLLSIEIEWVIAIC